MSEKSYTLYFARPITKLDYIAMKFGTVGMTMLMATLIPITVTYIGLVALSSVGTDYMLGHVWVWGALFAYNLLIIIVLTSLALAFSALTSRRFYAAFGLVVTFFMSTLLGAIIVGMFNNKNGTIISIGDSVQIVGAKIFGVTGIKYDYPWELNLATLVIMSAVATAFVIFKIWKTELSE
jgi:ABC-type transport system involved in multi-copper enzyme maturation permease subunit